MKTYLIGSALMAAAFAATLPLEAQQATQLPGSKSAAAITGGTYQADPNHTLVGWRVDHFGFSPYFGLFGDISGTLILDPKNPQDAKVDVTIPVAKVTTASAGLTAHLLRPAGENGKADFFGPAPAPARFVSTKVHVHGPDAAHIMGDLTLNGVTRPVVLDAQFYGAGKAPAMRAVRKTSASRPRPRSSAATLAWAMRCRSSRTKSRWISPPPSRSKQNRFRARA